MAGGFGVGGVEHHMGELDGEILAFDRRDFARIGEEAEQLALGQFDDDAVAIAGIVRSDRAGGEVRLRDAGLQFFEAFGRAGEGGGADMGFRRLFKRDEIGEAARSAQIMGAASHFGGGHAPDVGEESGGLCGVGQRQFDAAQFHFASPWVRPAAAMPAMAQASSISPVSPLVPTAPIIRPSKSRMMTPPGDKASWPPVTATTL